MNNKISDKDKKDWKEFISNKDKLSNKDLYLDKNKINRKITKKIDLHGLSLENANKFVEQVIIESFKKNVSKIIVITGKGSRSKNKDNPYVSEELSILMNSVPEFIKTNLNLIKIIKNIKVADIEDGGKGAFYIYLKNKFR